MHRSPLTLLLALSLIVGRGAAEITRSVWHPPAELRQELIWPQGAPAMANWRRPPEHAETGLNPQRFAGRPVTGVYDVTVPTMTIFPPRGRKTRAAEIVLPGGGFKQLAIDLEGTEACDWLTARGITCVLLKYRVPDTGHHYDPACDCGVTPVVPRALQDAQRATRLIRARAASLGIDPDRIGAVGFSASGYLVAQLSNMAPVYRPVDAADRLSSRPDFAVALYPGHLCRDGRFAPGLRVTKAAPPTFLLHARDDPTDPVCNTTMYAHALTAAGVPTEVHLFARGGHAFALRPTGQPIDGWPALVEHWIRKIGMVSA